MIGKLLALLPRLRWEKKFYWYEVASNKTGSLIRTRRRGPKPDDRNVVSKKFFEELEKDTKKNLTIEQVNQLCFESVKFREAFFKLMGRRILGPNPVRKRAVASEPAKSEPKKPNVPQTDRSQAQKSKENLDAGNTLLVSQAGVGTDCDQAEFEYAYMFEKRERKWVPKRMIPADIKLVAGARLEIREGSNSDLERAKSGDLLPAELLLIYFLHKADAEAVFNAVAKKQKELRQAAEKK